MGRRGQVLGKGGSGRGATGYRSLNPDPIRKGTDFCHQLLLGSMVWSNSVGLTDPHILSESQREPCEPLGLSTVEEEGALKDFRALSRHFSNNPRACTLPARTACLTRSLPQLVGKDLARGTPGYFGMLLQPCVSCKPAPHSQCWSLEEKLCFSGGENLKEPGD